MQRESEGSNSYERENSALAVNTVNGRQILEKGVGIKSTEEKGAERAITAIRTLTGQDIEEEKRKEYFPVEHARDINSRTIFHSSELTCQFLRDYTGISLFSDLRPEDIEDVTGRYKAFLGVEFEADTVKKVRVRVPAAGRASGTRL